MKKIILFIFILHLLSFNCYANYYYEIQKPDDFQQKYLSFGEKQCGNITQEDIPTIFIPGILSSWYSEEGLETEKVKRWIPDPITHSYDTLFYTFKKNGYELKDVFYESEYDIYIEGNPKKSLYLFGYDWKKDNKITATMLNNLISQIRKQYIEYNGCDIGLVNIVAHSMGGLVARAMLEDMCVSEEELEEYKNIEQANGQIYDFTSTKCSDTTKINKFITISTPHRGSPQAFPIWEKGDVGATDTLIKSTTLLSQFSITNSKKFYSIVHGFNKKIPNGIVAIGQLLPDIQNDNDYNDKLRYLLKDKDSYYINFNNYPKNSFLEELNKEKNINKMWDKIDSKFSSYYSILTGNNNKNNITGFNLVDTDNTKKELGKDIYDNYSSSYNGNIYNIDSIIQKQDGVGGDGTVPTYNLLLVPNDSVDGKQIINNKFESIELKCYGEFFPRDIDGIEKKEEKEKKQFYSSIYKNIGTNSIFEACSHSNTPTSLSYDIYSNIIGKEIKGDKNEVEIIKRKELLQNIGYTNYYTNKFYSGGLFYDKVGITNSRRINDIFENNYVKVVSEEEFKKDSESNPIKVSLSYDGAYENASSVFTRYDILSPINLIIEDEQGRKIGIDPNTGMIINEIPGAWTSGNTEDSNEPEFFLIPRIGTGEINHKISTFGTGDGEYHIVVQEINLSDTGEKSKEELIIAGEAKENFGEDYLISINNNELEYEILSSSVFRVNINNYNFTDAQKEYILEKLEKIINKLDFNYSDKQRNLILKLLKKHKKNIIGKVRDDFKRDMVSYVIDYLVRYLEK